MTTAVEGADLESRLDHWIAAGLITSEQADRIRADERACADGSGPTAQRASLVVEALGYLGGVLVLVAILLLTAQLWEDLAVWLRLTLPALAGLLLLATGLALPREGDPVRRLRAVVWALSVAAVAAGVVVGAQEAGLVDEDVALVTGLAAAGYGAALWRAHRTPLQQAALLVALVVSASSAAARLETEALPGLAAWVVGVLWLTLGLSGRLVPQRTACALGSVAAVLGAQATMSHDLGNALAVVTAAALVVVAVAVGDLGLLAVAAVGTLMILPQATTHYFPGALSAPVALLVGGVLLVGAALRTANPRRTRGPAARDLRASRYPPSDT